MTARRLPPMSPRVALLGVAVTILGIVLYVGPRGARPVHRRAPRRLPAGSARRTARPLQGPQGDRDPPGLRGGAGPRRRGPQRHAPASRRPDQAVCQGPARARHPAPGAACPFRRDLPGPRIAAGDPPGHRRAAGEVRGGQLRRRPDRAPAGPPGHHRGRHHPPDLPDRARLVLLRAQGPARD